jgi:hypothetical protein
MNSCQWSQAPIKLEIERGGEGNNKKKRGGISSKCPKKREIF